MFRNGPESVTNLAQPNSMPEAASSSSDAPCPCVERAVDFSKSTHRISPPSVCCQELGAYWVWLWLHDSTRPERSVTVISTIP